MSLGKSRRSTRAQTGGGERSAMLDDFQPVPRRVWCSRVTVMRKLPPAFLPNRAKEAIIVSAADYVGHSYARGFANPL